MKTEKVHSALEQPLGFLSGTDVGKCGGQDHLGDDRSPVVVSELLTAGLAEFSIQGQRLLGPSRFSEPIGQVVRGDERLPTPMPVPLFASSQGLAPGRQHGFGREMRLVSIPERSERPTS